MATVLLTHWQLESGAICRWFASSLRGGWPCAVVRWTAIPLEGERASKSQPFRTPPTRATTTPPHRLPSLRSYHPPHLSPRRRRVVPERVVGARGAGLARLVLSRRARPSAEPLQPHLPLARPEADRDHARANDVHGGRREREECGTGGTSVNHLPATIHGVSFLLLAVLRSESSVAVGARAPPTRSWPTLTHRPPSHLQEAVEVACATAEISTRQTQIGTGGGEVDVQGAHSSSVLPSSCSSSTCSAKAPFRPPMSPPCGMKPRTHAIVMLGVSILCCIACGSQYSISAWSPQLKQELNCSQVNETNEKDTQPGQTAAGRGVLQPLRAPSDEYMMCICVLRA